MFSFFRESIKAVKKIKSKDLNLSTNTSFDTDIIDQSKFQLHTSFLTMFKRALFYPSTIWRKINLSLVFKNRSSFFLPSQVTGIKEKKKGGEKKYSDGLFL